MAKKTDYEHKPSQYDQMMYLERMERLVEVQEETNELLKQLIKSQESAKSTTTAKKTTTQTKDEAKDSKED